jgi:tetratricopeptide (TPR) repeat protein
MTSSSLKKQSNPPARRRPLNRKPLLIALYVVVALCFMVAWATPIRKMASRRMWEKPDAASRDAYGFIALAYTGSQAKPAPDAADDAQIHSHIDAMIANGYAPITLDDAAQLLIRGVPVPRKAVLLTVDARDKHLLYNARSAVRRYRWHGVAFFSPDASGERTGNTPSRRLVRTLDRSDEWDVGLLGTPEVAAGTESRKTHIRPVALAYPDGDFGQYAPAADRKQDTILAAAARYDLAFTLGETGRNTMFTDRLRLNRMVVDPSWSASDLIAALKSANREIELVEDVDLTRKATGWITERGRMAIGDAGLELSTLNGSGDARVWLGGSDVRRDFSAALDFKIGEGNASFYARAAADRSSYILIEFAPGGDAVLKQKSVLNPDPVTLAKTRFPIRKGKTYRMAVFMRDSNINVTLDGLPVFNTHEQSIGVKSAGMIGAAITAATPEENATMTIDNVILQSRRSTLVSWNFDKALDPYVIHWVQTHGSRLTEISPPLEWMRDYVRSRETGSRSLYRHLASMYNLRLTPVIRISSASELEAWPPVSLAGMLSDLDCDGLYVNFEKYSDLQVRELEQWLRQTGRLLSGAGRPVLVRLPRMLERLSAVYSLLALIPSVEIVTDANTLVPLASIQSKQIIEETIETPSAATVNSLSPVFTVEEIAKDDAEKPVDKQIREWIEAGETAFRRSSYESAIAAFSEWHRLAPSAPAPLRRIGDALANLGYADEAVGFYHQSLDIDPSQISLATRLAKLLLETGRKTEARNLLNSYARLFPDSADVLLAQAEWLYRENRTGEAEERVERILRMDPEHFDATLFLLRIADNEESRAAAMDRLMKISNTPEQQYSLIAAIQQHDLLTYQNSHLLIAVMDQIARNSKDPRIHEIISSLEPLTTAVAENFAATGALSKNWQIEGASGLVDKDTLNVRANPARNEFSVRLLRSERWRDSFIEATADEVKGGFWLYARRSRQHLVRFGFDATAERLHLQVWKGRNNDVVASMNVPWTFPAGGCTLRLEIRGKGISGLINGKPAFDVPLALPDDFGLGWTAFSVQSPDRGQASATLRSLSSGPIPVRIALTPASPAADDKGDQTARLRARLPVLTDVSPDWFTVDDSGSWNSAVNEESDFYRLFARYHRLRLTPVVRVSGAAAISAGDIITVCRTHGFDGLILWFESLPPSSWFDVMDRDLNAPGLDVIAIAAGASGSPTIRGIASSRTLFREYGAAVPFTMVGADDNETKTVDTGEINDPVTFRF